MYTKEIGIIGLGKFGFHLGKELSQLGHRVIGLDIDDKNVQQANSIFSAVYQGNATDKAVLQQLGFQDFDCVVVSTGNSMESSILITLNLKEITVRDVIVKAVSPQHKTVMERLGVSKVIQPEQDAAVQTAHRIHNPGMVDLLPIAGGTLLQTVIVREWQGKTLAELSLPNTLGVMVVAIKKETDADFRFVPDARQPLEAEDCLLIIGPEMKIRKLKT